MGRRKKARNQRYLKVNHGRDENTFISSKEFVFVFILLSSACQQTQEEISHNKRGFHMRLHSAFSCRAMVLFAVFMISLQ